MPRPDQLKQPQIITLQLADLNRNDNLFFGQAGNFTGSLSVSKCTSETLSRVTYNTREAERRRLLFPGISHWLWQSIKKGVAWGHRTLVCHPPLRLPCTDEQMVPPVQTQATPGTVDLAGRRCVLASSCGPRRADVPRAVWVSRPGAGETSDLGHGVTQGSSPPFQNATCTKCQCL